ncbi:glutaredoxin family protein [Peribacillus sp. FSL H8-0477]|uniref:glutaredoxin family protein n=1 Tax=Peribacillus sp. FSL H8-0477 TaxID=2921388 RepID=UPI0030F9184A
MSEVTVLLWAKNGCSYCEDVKEFFAEKQIDYKVIDVTEHDNRRDILEAKYGVRYVPVIEIGKDGQYTGVTELGLKALEKELKVQKVL